MKIMILVEHHGNRYLDVSTQEKLEKASLSVVKGRFGGNNEYYPIEAPVDPGPPPFTEEQIEQLDKLFQPVARTEVLRHKSKLQSYNNEKKLQESIRYCIENNDGKLAYRILQSRRGYEDESFEIVSVDEVY